MSDDSSTRAGYMERTKDYLEYIDSNPDATSRDVASAFGVTQGSAGTKLKTFADRGWVKRSKGVSGGGRPAYRYTITDDGYEKLEWYREIEDIMDKQGVSWARATELKKSEEEL